MRLDLDVRREWLCPQCGRRTKSGVSVVTQPCACAPGVWMQLVEHKRSRPAFVLPDCTDKTSGEVTTVQEERPTDEAGSDKSAGPPAVLADSEHLQTDALQAENRQSPADNDGRDRRSSTPTPKSDEPHSSGPASAEVQKSLEAADAPSQASAATGTVESSAADTERSSRKRDKKRKRGRRGHRNKAGNSQSRPKNSRPAKDT